MAPNKSNNYCCGGGGGFLQSGFPEARREYGRDKVRPDSEAQGLSMPSLLVITAMPRSMIWLSIIKAIAIPCISGHLSVCPWACLGKTKEYTSGRISQRSVFSIASLFLLGPGGFNKTVPVRIGGYFMIVAKRKPFAEIKEMLQGVQQGLERRLRNLRLRLPDRRGKRSRRIEHRN